MSSIPAHFARGLALLGSMLAVACGPVDSAWAQYRRADDLMTGSLAASLGLQIEWTQTLATPYGVQSLVDIRLEKDATAQQRFLEIVADQGAENERVLTRIRLPELLVPEAAGKQATPDREEDEIRRIASNDIRRLKRRGITATIREIKQPRMWIYAIANDGTLERRDAETGKLDWRARVGDRRLGYGPLGVGNSSVVVTNGGNIIQVRAETGIIRERLSLRRAELFGASVAGDYVIVHTVGGNFEAYPRRDIMLDPYTEHVQGSALSPPVQAPTSSLTCWTTSSEHCYVMESQGTPSVLFRLETDGIAPGGAAAASGDRFFLGCNAGMVYGIRATRTGDVMWSQAIGVPFEERPIIVGDRVLIRSVFGTLHCLNAANGDRLWDQPVRGVGEIHTAVEDDLYVTTAAGLMAVIDVNTGRARPLAKRFRPTQILNNTLTNRLYLVGTSGAIQCLRPTDSPLIKWKLDSQTVPDGLADEAAQSELAPADAAAGVQAPADDAGGNVMDDLFGGGGGADDDPFGGMGGDDNPFGGSPF
ncbi:MAG: PQQ-binding-like beta-propeller repeat protein [Planctomycetota bacterium]